MWPFLILIGGVVVIALMDTAIGGFFFMPLVLFGILFFFMHTARSAGGGRDAEAVRRAVVTLSIAALLPVFIRYFVRVADYSLAVILIGLVLGFGLAVWGMLMKGNRVLMHANLVGGAIVLVYIYTQLWALGEGARIVAAAAGLIIAVVVSVIKLREKLR